MRTFIATEIDSQEVINSVKRVQAELKIRAKPVLAQNIHFTLFFLGDISNSMSQKIQDVMNTIEFKSFDVKIVGMGAFPKPSFPRVIWVGTDKEGGRKLIALASIVEEKLSSLGFQKDKPFKPHITIFRVKNKIRNISEELKKYQEYSFGIQKISKIKFKKSVLASDGPTYSDIQVVETRK